ncbi:Hpt domain-containing protein [Perlucidibaca piscinae]|uniref:Hpt domain-containing protein n=1 Tax=Perlucidibaca piscinae TaxID=392589 RepID=UPI00040218F2|nr:Hpt domain-containing protein [Perlucidibaca piscinae]
MLDDAVDDAAWQAMLADFRAHFWASRVPLFLQTWETSRTREAAVWGEELKRSLHGIAGVAGMVGHDDIGRRARDIERLWERRGESDVGVRNLLVDLASDLQRLDPGL